METVHMRQKQLVFPQFKPLTRLDHGGSIRTGRRKLMRPIDPKKSIHLVLHSTRAYGAWSMLRPKHFKRVRGVVDLNAKRFRVRVYQYANVGNHLHILVKVKKREDFQGFLRAISGTIARMITGAKKGNPVGRFWDALAFTRVVSWRREFLAAKFYVIQNEMEAEGIWSRKWNRVRMRE